MKKLIVFDLDGTLAESKSSLDGEMSALLRDLLGIVKVAVISGGNWPQFEKQLVSKLADGADLNNLSLLPTCGTKFYKYNSVWEKLYSEDFTGAETDKIISSLQKAIGFAGVAAETRWGELIEDRGSQITLSALGQQAPLEEKKKWDPDFAKRKRMKAFLDNLIPEFSVRLGGTTSIDVTKQGVDKAYGIGKLRDILGVAVWRDDFRRRCLVPRRKRLSGQGGRGCLRPGQGFRRDQAGRRGHHRLLAARSRREGRMMKTHSDTDAELLRKLDAYWRAANYLSVGQIYLYDNPLLKRPLALTDVKRMLLGHWGTTPGRTSSTRT